MYESLVMVAIAFMFGVLYTQEKDAIAKSVFLFVAILFAYGALAFNPTLVQTDTFLSGTNTITTYTYQNGDALLGPMNAFGYFIWAYVILFLARVIYNVYEGKRNA